VAGMKITIDSKIWVCAFSEKPGEWSFDCEGFLYKFIESNHSLAVDYERNVLREYNDNLKYNERYRAFYRMLDSSHRIEFVDATLTNKHKGSLLALGFHEPEDHVFVGVAYNADKMIITEDSDYGKGIHPKAKESDKQAVLRYMITEMELKVLDSNEAKQAM
jgi:predicted nucleic acid-binding protein